MGTDTPISVLSERPKLLYTYFKQLFAQVTNPPIDSIREELVMSLVSLVGPRPNLLDLDSGGAHRRLEVSQPVLTNADLDKIRHVADIGGRGVPDRDAGHHLGRRGGRRRHGPRAGTALRRGERAVEQGFNILILSDRAVGPDRVALPALLACSAVHHRLILEGSRTGVGLVLETGEAREVHHFCVLAGYGAEAVNPYLAFETLDALHDEGAFPAGYTREKVQKNYIKAVSKGLLKVMSKMGISTYQSYCGAQIFDAVGLASEFVDRYFTGTATTVEGASARRGRGRDRGPAPMPPGATRRSTATCSMSAANMPSGCAANEPPVGAGLGRQAAACLARQQRRELRGICRGAERPEPQADDLARAVRVPRGRQRRAAGGGGARRRDRQAVRDRAPCPSARSRARRTPRSPSP